ncbi:MAG: L-serine ammonia-lyase, iron-sulfur-dependent, subunit alpha [Clostridia bacterium]
MKPIYEDMLLKINDSMMPSTGCTEPVAIALNTATARKHAAGAVKKLTVTMDSFLYKNAMGVGIPGSDERGVALCAALGVTAGNADALLRVLEQVTSQALAEAKKMVAEGLVEVRTLPGIEDLLIESVLETERDTVRVVTRREHTGITRIDHAPFEKLDYAGDPAVPSGIQDDTLEQFIDFADHVPIESLHILKSGIEMNRAVAEKGKGFGLGKALDQMIRTGVIGTSVVSEAQLMCASASFARMSGISMPVMTATGSGNQGITLLLSIDAVAQRLKVPEEKKLRAVALGSLINIYVKSYIGALSAACACGVASGLGASVGIVYMMDGTPEQMLYAMKNILGSISGMICDGAKEGCASKVELACGLAVEAAFLALGGMGVSAGDGIVGNSLKSMFENLGTLVKEGMFDTNRVIVEIMQGEKAQ